MAGGLGTGLFIHGYCLICRFEGNEEINTPHEPRTPRIEMWYQIRQAKKNLVQRHIEHQERSDHYDCCSEVFFSFWQSEPYRESLRGIDQAAEIAAQLLAA
jgi:hypothetical protein